MPSRANLATAVLGFTVAVLCATPSLADCKGAVEGARVCRDGIVTVCSAGEMLQTVLSCKMGSGDAREMTAVPPEHAAGPRQIAIRTAVYRAGSVAMDFVYRLRALCDGKPNCALTGDSALLQGDPMPRQSGQFSVIYACVAAWGDSESRQVVFAKGAAETLDCRE
ncbi:MAG TPA: hypothetical protein VHZ78_06335 [Rhizomicrobium sp.]|jgi:hypothetical protein|nr:hypothetical protein [Rhizomicrobium sp.]